MDIGLHRLGNDSWKQKKGIHFIMDPVKAYLTVFALNAEVRLWTEEEVLALTGGTANFAGVFWAKLSHSCAALNAGGLLLFGALLFVYVRLRQRQCGEYKNAIRILAALFSLFTIFGISYAAFDSWDFVLQGKYQMFLSLLIGCGYYFLYHAGLSVMMLRLKKGIRKTDSFGKIEEKINRHFSLFAFGVIFLCWLPYLLIMLPGSLPGDGYVELNMYLGYQEWTTHHPLFSTLLMGNIFALGKNISDNFGVFLYVFLQMLVCSWIYGRVCAAVNKMHISKKWSYFSLAFFAVMPLWGSYAQAMIKDTLHTGFFIWFLLIFYVCVKEKETISKRAAVELIVSGILTVITRNDRIYIVIPCLLALMWLCKRRRVQILAVCALVLVGYVGVNKGLASYMNVGGGSIREALSIPLQQTARYGIEYGDEVTEEERQILDTVLDYEAGLRDYDPELSDYVKNHFKLQNDETDKLKDYFAVWFEQLKKHPDAYFQATLNNTFGYVYPFYDYQGRAYYQLYIDGPPVATGDLDIHYVNKGAVISALRNYAEAWRKFPVTAQLMNPASYVWAFLIVCAMWLAKKRWSKISLMLPGFLIILVCLASPVNGYSRYLLPLMAYLPLLLGDFLEEFVIQDGAEAV